MDYHILRTFWFLLLWQQSAALYLPTRMRMSLNYLRSPTLYDGLRKPTLQFYGRDERTHQVTDNIKAFGRNQLRISLQKKKLSQNSVLYDSSKSHHRVAKDTHNLVVTSFLAKNSNGKTEKKYLVFRDDGTRAVVKKPKRGTKVKNWWG